MRVPLLVFLITLFAFGLFAQDNFAAAGVSYNPGASPPVAGTGLYARLLPGTTGTYSFTTVDALVTSTKPFTIGTNIATGLAQKLFTVGSLTVYASTGGGVSWNGKNTGWTWNGGGLVPLKLGKSSWFAVPAVRFIKSSVNQNSDYQLIATVMLGKGW